AGQAWVVVYQTRGPEPDSRFRRRRGCLFHEDSGITWPVGKEVLQGVGMGVRGDRDGNEERQAVKSRQNAHPFSPPFAAGERPVSVPAAGSRDQPLYARGGPPARARLLSI